MKRVALVVLLLGVGACANRALQMGAPGPGADAAAGTGGGGGASPSTGGAGGSPSTGGTGGSPSTGGAGASTPGVALACAATCDTPVAQSIPLSSNGALVGRWEICSGHDQWTKLGAPLDTIGVEYTPDGHTYYLVTGPAGPERGVGFAYQLTYDLLSTGQLNMHPAPNAGFFGSASLSPCPRVLQIAPFAYDALGSTLVPFDYDPNATPPPSSAPTCAATCETPAGTVASSLTLDQSYAALAGRWLVCGDRQRWWTVGAPTDVVGVEFGVASRAPTANGGTMGGKMYYLVQGSAGLVRGVGAAYQLTYDLSPEGRWFQLNIHATPSSGFGGSFRYSPCPRELELPGMGAPSSVLTPAPELMQ
jgi:hypothetical protein